MATSVRTFLFTDLEGSTRRWQQDALEMREVLARHDAILRQVVQESGGTVVKHTGDGVLAVFTDPLRAVEAATEAQRSLRTDPGVPPVRMGLHVGSCTERDGDFFGPTLNRAARIMAVAHGGQVLVSGAVADLVRDSVAVDALGSHRLRDLVEPELIHQVVVEDSGAYPPVRSLVAWGHNLPAPGTRLLGREQDVATVRDLLASARLVTLAGVGGVGKTRLAIEVAARELDRRDGAVFVDLAPVADPALVPSALALALGLPPGEGGADAATVLRLLSARPTLVVLDNCEHLLDACAELAETILDGVPEVSVLATSREPLGVEAERVWRVPSLDAAGVELFVERAAAIGVDVRGAEEVIAEVCRQLDGIPLAIELAAARASHLSVPEIAARLEQRFQLLTGGRRRARQRHQTLQAALDWSHELLDDDERLVLRRAAVFTGGFSLAALEHVAAPDCAGSVVDLLGSLVDRSLVVAEPARYRLLETVRLYGLDRLAEAGEVVQARDRHAEWTRSWLGDPGLPTILVERSQERLAERDNVLAALEWVAERGDLAEIGRFASIAYDGLGDGVWVDESWRWFGRPDVEAALGDEDLARYLLGGAGTASALGDFPRQAELAERSRSTADPGRRTWRHATVLLANALSVLDPDRSAALYEELLEAIPATDHDLALVMARSADPALMREDIEEGARRHDEAMRLGGSPDLDYGVPHLILGRFDAVEEAIEAHRHRSVGMSESRTHLLAGMLAAVTGRFDDAADELVTAARLVERFPIQLLDRDVLNGFAVLAHHRGDHRRAAELLAVASNGPVWSRTPGMFAVHMHYRSLLRQHLDRSTIADLRAGLRHVTVLQALDEETARAQERGVRDPTA